MSVTHTHRPIEFMTTSDSVTRIMDWNYKKILIVRNDLRGDLICTTPVLQSLKETYPKIQIDILVKDFNLCLIRGNPWINRLFSYRSSRGQQGALRKLHALLEKAGLGIKIWLGNYDAIIVPRRIPARNASFFLRMARNAITVGTDSVPGKTFEVNIQPNPNQHEVLHVFNYFKSLGISYANQPLWIRVEPVLEKLFLAHRNSILIHLSADRQDNCYPWRNFQSVVRALPNERFVVTYAPREADFARAMASNANVSALDTSIAEFIALVGLCKLAISPDGGVIHFATARKTPIISLFGSKENASRWFPWGNQHLCIASQTGLARDIDPQEILQKISTLNICLEHAD